MKLIFCKYCQDVIKLIQQKRSCQCGKISGYYVDHLNAEVSDEAIVIGFDNSSLMKALVEYKNQPNGIPVKGRYYTHKGFDFNAFIIPEGAPSVKRKT